MAIVPISRARRELAAWPERFDDLLSSFFGRGATELLGGGNWYPTLDIADKGDSLVVEVELPGMKAEDIELSVDGNMLTISGEKKSESEQRNGNYYHVERSYGKFQRTISLPSEVDNDKIQAKAHHGVLTVTLPKSEQAKPRKIEVKS